MGKLGFSNLGFSIGGVIERAKMETEIESSSQTGYARTTRYGGFIGYQLPIMLGLSVSYLLPPDGIKNSPGSSMLAFSAGYSLVPFVKLTFNYSMSIQAQYFDSNGTGSLPHTTADSATYKDDF